MRNSLVYILFFNSLHSCLLLVVCWLFVSCLDSAFAAFVFIADIAGEVLGNLWRQLLTHALREDFGRSIGQVHVSAVGDYDEVGGESSAGEHGEDFLYIVLSISIDRSSIVITALPPGDDRFVEIISCITKPGE